MEVLDQIEKTDGPGVLVTIGTGERHFSTGFDLKYWMKSYDNMYDSIHLFQRLLAKLIAFPLPSLCVFNGTAIAGGYFMGLAHDYRIMHDTKGTICLSELKLGFALPPTYIKFVVSKLHSTVASKLFMAVTVDPI